MALDPGEIQFDDVAEDVGADDSQDGETTEVADEAPAQPDNQEEEDVVEEPDSLEDFSDEDLDDAFEDEEEPSGEQEDTPEDEEQQDPENEEDEDTEETEEAETRFVDDLASQFGLDPEDDLDEDLDDTWDDALKVAKTGAQKMAQREMDSFFEKYPDVAEYTKYRVNGGDPDKFREEVLEAPDYDDLELEGNERTQKQVVREKLKEVDGLSEERIEDKIDRWESGGYLKSEAEDARDIMSQRQEKKREQLVKEQEKKAEQRRQQQLEEQKKYRETIHESSDLAGLQLPENEKEDFEKWVFEPADEEGHTRAEKAYQELDRDQELAMYYMMYKGFDLGDLVDNKASTKKAEQISDKLKKTSSKRDVKDKTERSKKDRDVSNDLEGFELDKHLG